LLASPETLSPASPVAGGLDAGGAVGVKADSTAVRERSEPTAERRPQGVLDPDRHGCDPDRQRRAKPVKGRAEDPLTTPAGAGSRAISESASRRFGMSPEARPGHRNADAMPLPVDGAGRGRHVHRKTCPLAGSPMTYIVTDACVRCKYMDCVEVCPVDCFYEGENFLVIHPDECIDCGVCEPECPVDAIRPDTEDDPDGKWLRINTDYAKVWPNITVKGEPPADRDEFAKETGKFEKYFSTKPGEGS
jgi:ferredoxin